MPGEANAVPSNKVSDFVDSDFYYYYDFYAGFKCAGPPWACGWLDWPPWTLQLINNFDAVIEEMKRYNEEQAYRNMRAGR